MERVIRTCVLLGAYGLILALTEFLLPDAGAKRSARAAIGLVFLKLLIDELTGIFR